MNLVIYFSRSGICKKVSDVLSESIECETIELKDNMNWKGLFGFIRAGYHSNKGSSIDYLIKELDFNNYDEIFIIAPIWAGKVQPTVRTFISDNSLHKARLILTHASKEANEMMIRNNKFITRKKPVYFCLKDVYKSDFKEKLNNQL